MTLEYYLALLLDTPLAHHVRRKRRLRAAQKLDVFRDRTKPEMAVKDSSTSRTIWQIWDDGDWQSARTPPLVRASIKSVATLSQALGCRHQVLSFEKAIGMLDVPEELSRKFNSGVISKAQMSDILRSGLLGKFGGVWIDATVFVIAPERAVAELRPDYLLSHGNHMSEFSGDFFFDSYLLAADKGRVLFESVYQALVRFWSAQIAEVDYFQFHILLSLEFKEIRHLELFSTSEGDVPARMHGLQRDLLRGEKLNPRFDFAHYYPIQKLTHKGLDSSRIINSQIYNEILNRGFAI